MIKKLSLSELFSFQFDELSLSNSWHHEDTKNRDNKIFCLESYETLSEWIEAEKKKYSYEYYDILVAEKQRKMHRNYSTYFEKLFGFQHRKLLTSNARHDRLRNVLSGKNKYTNKVVPRGQNELTHMQLVEFCVEQMDTNENHEFDFSDSIKNQLSIEICPYRIALSDEYSDECIKRIDGLMSVFENWRYVPKSRNKRMNFVSHSCNIDCDQYRDIVIFGSTPGLNKPYLDRIGVVLDEIGFEPDEEDDRIVEEFIKERSR